MRAVAGIHIELRTALESVKRAQELPARNSEKQCSTVSINSNKRT